MKRRIDWFMVLVCVIFAVSCGGGGCSGCGGCTLGAIPGGFPAGKRTANAGQIRISQTGLAAVTANPAGVIAPLLGNAMNGVIKFPVPASCGGSTPICCPGGVPNNNCGPIDIDLTQHAGDSARLVLAPQQGASQLNVTVNARIKTEMTLPVSYSGSNCLVGLDTSPGTYPDLQITTSIQFVQDATTGTTKINATGTAVNHLESGDYTLTGDILCYIAGFLIPASTIEGLLATPIEDAINGATCKACTTVADCGSTAATACTGGQCMEGSACLQELGLDGRLASGSLLGSISPGTSGGLDLYEVAGGYGTTNNNGIALGLLGGMEPAAKPRDLCGPASAEPAAVTVPQSTYFQGNTRPDTSAPFDVAIGLHKSQLDQFAYAGYDGGLLCLTIGHSFVSELTTDTLSILSRSLGHLVEKNSPMAIGLRPQTPPTITLGPNTFMPDGNGGMTLNEPLLDIHFTAMEIDFFAEVDQQYIRVFTVVSDVHLPVGLQVGGMGELTPVIGNPMDAFTNISVKNSEAVTETPDALSALFPTVLGLVLPQLSNGLSPIALPTLGGLSLDVTAITAVDNSDFLAIFANLVPTAMARPVRTTVDIVALAEPTDAIAHDPKQWANAKPTAVTLALGADARDVEFSVRTDSGTWSPWSASARETISSRSFWLAGVHHLQVRARQIGHPETIDTDPPTIELPIGVATTIAKTEPGGENFHGTAGAAGCTCDSSAGFGGSAPFALVIALILLPLRRARRVARRVARNAMRLGPIVWTAALLCLPGCSCGSKPCGDAACMPGTQTGAVGRWTSIAGDDKRVMIATYDQVFGDLVVADATDPTKIDYKTVDGVPANATPTYDPSTWRGGVTDAGPNVGAWTSIVLSNHTARVAYQDRDALALKYAFEGDSWNSYVIDAGNGEAVGEYANMVIDADGHPAIAYLGVGVDDGMGHRTTELRLARSSSSDPQSESSWGITTIATGVGTCAGLCGGSEECVQPATATDPQTCVTPTTDCTATCAMGDTCSAGACLTTIVDPMIDDIPTGTGLFVSLVVLPDGRLAAAYYDLNKRALTLGLESAKGTSMFAETILDGNVAGADRGMWSAAVVAGDGTIHIAYQDALGDQLMYTTWNTMPGVPEVVDDGERMGDRTHPVGASAQIYLVSGSPVIAYQDAMTADVYLATLSGTTWTTNGLAVGPLLDGFSIAATTGHGAPVLAWDSLNPANTPPNGLVVQSP